MYPVACTPSVFYARPRRPLPFITLGHRVDNFVNAKMYDAQRGARAGMVGGVGLGGLVGAAAGALFASNPFTAIAMTATSALLGGAGGAALGGVLGLGTRRYF